MTMTARMVTCLLVWAAALLPMVAGVRACAADDDAAAKKADGWLAAMTLDEKIGQMTQVDFKAFKDLGDITRLSLGSVLCGGNSDPDDITPAGWAKAQDDCQALALKARLKIPLIFGVDAVHGHNNVDGAVIFPHNVGLGASRDPSVVEKAARVTALEMVGTGIRWAFAPCVAVARNERWGRTYESFGERPELAAELGPAAVRGLQGDSLAAADSVLACVKHFVGDGGTTNGVDQGNTECDEAALRQIHLPGYVASIKQGAGSIMASYSSWNGKKLHGHKYLVTDLLKGELGFGGFVVSDWAGVDQLSPDFKAAIDQSINAGVDMVMIPNGPGQKNNYVEFIDKLKELVNEGKVPASRIDDAVRRILLIKARMNLADHPYSDPALKAKVGSAEHREVARDCVRKTLVLLKNDRKVLPLSKSIKKLVVAGPAANDIGIQCGGWTIAWQGKAGDVIHGGTTVLAALKEALGPGVEVVHSADGSGAAGADAAVVVIGERPYAEMFGDRRGGKDLGLPADDLAALKKVREAGIPVATVVFSGRPVLLGPVLESSDAILAAWLPGTEGRGIADVLLGDYKPTAKLPHTWPRSMEQIPCNPEDGAASEALFPFGFGLSY
ncbi:Periplasmic beta-glucosidase precursor [Aquisphaera giovannonii]|uniref:beta-glucosidase n=1 Tax=Aquisphaera giovannonii TaxID=406548 RepID=A0A5B9WCA9_9BACT|nr:glycoside hydrolase family 3 N-terminal domain-containing protein [Aquisphaera giovannonii]QEH37685.1 Periplasmic beta-glucosidase precursor [Aquisphaera giovannonii]